MILMQLPLSQIVNFLWSNQPNVYSIKNGRYLRYLLHICTCTYLYKCVRLNGLPLENLLFPSKTESIINMFLLKSVLFLTISVIQCMYVNWGFGSSINSIQLNCITVQQINNYFHRGICTIYILLICSSSIGMLPMPIIRKSYRSMLYDWKWLWRKSYMSTICKCLLQQLVQ